MIYLVKCSDQHRAVLDSYLQNDDGSRKRFRAEHLLLREQDSTILPANPSQNQLKKKSKENIIVSMKPNNQTITRYQKIVQHYLSSKNEDIKPPSTSSRPMFSSPPLPSQVKLNSIVITQQYRLLSLFLSLPTSLSLPVKLFS